MWLLKTLNKEQRGAYDNIMSVVDTDQGGLFFVDGPGVKRPQSSGTQM
jgi:ATP-dependent DNA helicase PIF1